MVGITSGCDIQTGPLPAEPYVAPIHTVTTSSFSAHTEQCQQHRQEHQHFWALDGILWVDGYLKTNYVN